MVEPWVLHLVSEHLDYRPLTSKPKSYSNSSKLAPRAHAALNSLSMPQVLSLSPVDH
jgi:hypothetical protein